MLTELAIDSNYNDSQNIRKKEDQEFKKFIFLSNYIMLIINHHVNVNNV